MDIARYIGLFLLKNKFAYIHGLGNLELTRIPASHDGQALNAPQYDVRLTRGGSIDDTLANYIATHEATSISKAANSLRDFSIASRADLAAGKEVVIPSLGKFVEDARGIRFITDPSLDYSPPPIPVIRDAKRLEDTPSFKTEAPQDSTFQSSDGSGSIAWGKVALAVLIVLAILIGGYFAWRMWQKNSEKTNTQSVKIVDIIKTQPPVVIPVKDTSHHADTTHTVASAAPVADGVVRYIIGTYPARLTAEKRVKQLTGNGNKVEMLAKDSTTFYVIMPLTNSADTTHMKDSLRRVFNPKGVSIYR